MNIKNKFTLVELLTVFAVFAILAAITTPMVIKSLDRARRSTNYSNLKQLYIAMMYYAEDNNGFLPYLEVIPEDITEDSYNSQSLFLLLPYTKYNLEVFFPPRILIQDRSDPNSDLGTYLRSPEQLIPAIKDGTTNLMPGYAYSPVNNNGDAIMIGINDLSEDLLQEDSHLISPIITTYNRTYEDEAYMLLADGSVIREKGVACNDSIFEE